MSSKQRLSASVDADLLSAAADAVGQGRCVSISAWVNEALRLKLEQERRLAAMTKFIDDYEREHGKITEEDMQRAARRARQRAVPVRGAKSRRRGA